MIEPSALRVRRSAPAVSLLFLLGCGGDQGHSFVPNGGGRGVVIELGGGDAGADAGVPDAARDASGRADTSTKIDAPKMDAAETGGRAGSAGASLDAGLEAGAGGAGGPVDDPCTACEKARCSHPAGLGKSKTDSFASLLGAVTRCFSGAGWPKDQVDPGACDQGLVATSGPEKGTARSTLCQDVLKCVHQTQCPGVEADETQCYCGEGVGLDVCLAADFAPKGACKDAISAGVESTAVGTISTSYYDTCLATGTAFFILDNCDSNCCSRECLGAAQVGDPKYCNAPGTGGAGAGGGASGHGGAQASGGAGGTTAGAAGAGGSPAQGGGGTGAAGQSTGGAAGSAVTTLLQNATFDFNIEHWVAGTGAVASWAMRDAANGASGALDLRLAGGNPDLIASVAAQQCLAVRGGATYAIDAKVLIPGMSASLGGLGFVYFPSSDCSGSAIGTFSSDWSARDSWGDLSASTQLPAGARSMAVQLVVLKPYGQQLAEAMFDDIVVSPH